MTTIKKKGIKRNLKYWFCFEVLLVGWCPWIHVCTSCLENLPEKKSVIDLFRGSLALW